MGFICPEYKIMKSQITRDINEQLPPDVIKNATSINNIKELSKTKTTDRSRLCSKIKNKPYHKAVNKTKEPFKLIHRYSFSVLIWIETIRTSMEQNHIKIFN
ncbi:hypothetical protein U3516DRAFT_739168 [Neocallimastix sp. 'constans']